MKLLYASPSLSFTQVVRLTLDEAGIEYFCSDADASIAGIAGPMTGAKSRIYLLHDEDWQQAVGLVEGLFPASPPVPVAPPGKALPVWWVVVAVVVVVVLVGIALER